MFREAPRVRFQQFRKINNSYQILLEQKNGDKVLKLTIFVFFVFFVFKDQFHNKENKETY